jgi:acetyltransferase-like isoleucine patch superfamily enzyme
MKTLIVGMGEVGSALYSILKDKYQVDTYDTKTNDPIESHYEITHICIPYCDNFHSICEEYAGKSGYTVVHSSVPVGTCEKIINGMVFHSPVRGTHPDMKDGLLAYIKYVGYEPSTALVIRIVLDYFEFAGIKAAAVVRTRTTELMKLLELCRYGTYIAFAKEQEDICKAFDVDYQVAVSKYEESRNDGLKELGRDELCQPVLYPFKDFVGGHCTVEDMELLLKQVTEVPLLEAAYRIDRATKIWPDSNIYETAKIGKGCSIGRYCEIGHNVVIGNNVRVGAFTFMPEGVIIEDGVFIAPRVSFSNDKHPPSNKSAWGKILVKKNAVIGMGAIILPGVTIGENAVVGAGAVVTKDIPDNEVWYGTAAYPHGHKCNIFPGYEKQKV